MIIFSSFVSNLFARFGFVKSNYPVMAESNFGSTFNLWGISVAAVSELSDVA